MTADIKTIAAQGATDLLHHGLNRAVDRRGPAGAGRKPILVAETLGGTKRRYRMAAVHIGMLGSGKVARVVADFLEKAKLTNIVLDPVIKSSSGADLIDAAAPRVLIERLLPLATVLTPNVDEAGALTGIAVTNLDQMRLAAAKLHEMGARSVVVTGGHLEKAIDLLSFTSSKGIQQEVFKSDRQHSNSTHGTGCAFATAMAATWHEAEGYRRPFCWRKRMYPPQS